ncbi:MAG: squalene--hopene cyclase [Pseudomonadota bacterium]
MLQDRNPGLSESGASAWQATDFATSTRSDSIQDARRGLEALQQEDGHWVFDLEADATIPADYVFLEHFLDDIDQELEDRIGVYLRAGQAEHGGWSLYLGGDLNISASVRAYFALKLIGDDPSAPHMRRAREAILAHGGAARANVFTRMHLALFGQVPWRAVPVMPVELMLLPRWFPFHLDKVSYWSRVTIVPLSVLMALKPRARNPRGVRIDELFVTPPELERDYVTNPTGAAWGSVFLGIDRVLQRVQAHLPQGSRQRAIDKAVAFVTERLNGEDGLGGIFPPMASTVMVFDALGYDRDHPDFQIAIKAVRKLITERDGFAYVQPCLSPVWDTALCCHALMEAGAAADDETVKRGLDWLVDRQITEKVGDWARQRPDLPPGGWPFEYQNDHYPDIDDAAVVICALHRADPERYRDAIERGTEWVLGMQSRNGGWGSFDADNTHDYLNNIPFADHGALLDPPTADLTARCISMMGELGHDLSHPAVARGMAFLKSEQESDGSWFGRWGTNYIYGTWSVLCALNAIGEDMQAPYVRKAVDWLIARQQADGGWGESCASYAPEHKLEPVASLPTQTAWALLGLMAAGDAEHEATLRGIAYLESVPRDGAKWHEDLYNAVGFPRVFYLRYHGYSAFFPLWALARHANLMRRNDRTVPHGM